MKHRRITILVLALSVFLALQAGLLLGADAPTPAGADATKGEGWFESIMPAGLKKTGFLLAWWQWIGLFILAGLVVVADRLVVWGGKNFIARALQTEKFKHFEGSVNIPEKLWKNAERPFGILAAAIVVILLLPVLALEEDVYKILNLASSFVLAASGVWASYRLTDLASVYLLYLAGKTSTKLDDMLVPFVRKIAKVFVLAIGIVFILQNLDVEVGGLLAGLGVGGLAFALAAKDTVSNIFGSITVLFDQPFQVGDWVVVDGIEGTVERVGFRSTRVRTFYNSLITMPNSKLISSVIDNFGVRKFRRYKTRFGITYDTPPWKIEAFCEGLRELVRAHPYTRKDYFHVYVNDLGASAIEILVYIFHETPDWSTELRERHRFIVDSLRLAESLGVELAFPTQTIHLQEGTKPAPVPKAGKKTAGGRKSGKKGGADLDPVEAGRIGRETARGLAEEFLPGDGAKPLPVTFEANEK